MKIGVKVFDAMTKNPIVVKPTTSVSECAKIMDSNHVGSLIIRENPLLGIVTEQDIVRKIVAKGINPETTEIKTAMEPNLFTISGKEDIYDALLLMRDKNIRQIPVVQNGDLIGLLTIKDVLKIHPQLFELVVDKFQLREEINKPVFYKRRLENDCETCGNFSILHYLDYKWICDECAELKSFT